ncbi:glycosyltransferase [Candidatus Saccharibacteria bacterium]|nr:glycosyltransferase [Candidatus Saccharibacteria bacterium]
MKTKKPIRLGLVVPHIFLHRDILPNVIFSPGKLAIELAESLDQNDVDVTLFSPGPVETKVKNITADMSYFENELKLRGDTYTDLLKKHPFTFVTLARQVQAEIIAKAFAVANNNELDIVHIYTNEEDLALPFAQFCQEPVVFTHHDPFNFLVKYKNIFPKYSQLNWISMSLSQRKAMPKETNWIANIYHGLGVDLFTPVNNPKNGYIAFLGRIIEPKGLHLAIEAVKKYNGTARQPLKLKVAGKHYAEHSKDSYWQKTIEPELNGLIEYVGFIKDVGAKNEFLGNAKALIIPSLFEEPFGMVMIEALACGTPLIGLDSGAIPEVIVQNKTGFIVDRTKDLQKMIDGLATAIGKVEEIDRKACRQEFEDRFTLERMCTEHRQTYKRLLYTK